MKTAHRIITTRVKLSILFTSFFLTVLIITRSRIDARPFLNFFVFAAKNELKALIHKHVSGTPIYLFLPISTIIIGLILRVFFFARFTCFLRI